MRRGITAFVIAGIVAGCGTERAPESGSTQADGPPVPDFNATDMEPRVVAAIREARKKVLAEPGSAAAWGRLGIAFDAHDLFAPGLDAYREARRLDPADFRWAYFVARLEELTAGPEEEIVAAFVAATDLNPNYVPMLVRRGDALARLARPGEARSAYEQALARDPRFARAQRGLGQVLLALGEAELAVNHLRQAAELNPDDGAAQASLARALARTGDRAAARRAQARARTLDEDHAMPDPVLGEVSHAAVTADAYVRRARSWIEQGEPRRALRELEIASEIRTEDAIVEALLGGAYGQLRRDDEALDRYSRALAIREEYPEVHMDRASVLARNGRFDEAVVHFERAIELRPDEASYLAKLASARAQRGDLPGAIEAFEQASRLGELEAADQNNWGTALAQAGRASEAIPHFEEAVRLKPRYANAHFNLGVALEGVKQPDRAIQHYRRAVEIDPDHRARGRLAALTASPR